MDVIQLAISNAPYATALRQILERSGHWDVRCVEIPDLEAPGVVVVDSEALERLPRPLPHPERVVLVTANEPAELSRAWEAGIVSLVFDKDPLNTALLAILAARLRATRDIRRGCVKGPDSAADGSGVAPNGGAVRPDSERRR